MLKDSQARRMVEEYLEGVELARRLPGADLASLDQEVEIYRRLLERIIETESGPLRFTVLPSPQA